MQATLIINPQAGNTSRLTPEEIMDALRQAGNEPFYSPTPTEEDLDEALAGPTDLVVVAGADGSIRSAAIHLIGRNIPITPLPLGTANNICRMLSLNGKPLEIIASLADPVQRDMDMSFKGWSWFTYPSCVPWFLLCSDATPGKNNYLQISFAGTYSINTKYQFTVVYKGDLSNNTIKCYSNAQSVAPVDRGNTLTGSTVTNTNNSLLSDVNRRTSVYLDGIMFYQYLWNRALTASEVQSLYLSPYQFIRPVVPHGYYYESGFRFVFPTSRPIVGGVQL